MYRRHSLVPQTLLYQSYKLRVKVPFAIPSAGAEFLPELCNRDVSYVKIVCLARGPWLSHNRDLWCKWQYVPPEKWEAPKPTLLAFLSLSAPELFFLILAHPVYKMWIKQEQNTLELWNKLHFEEKKMESIYRV